MAHNTATLVRQLNLYGARLLAEKSAMFFGGIRRR